MAPPSANSNARATPSPGSDFAPPAPPAASLRSPQPPCASLRSGGGQTWRRVRGFWLAGWLVVGRAEGVACPPRFALPPEVGFLLEVVQRARTYPPRLAALRRCPPEWGETGGFFDVGVLRQGASRSAVSFMRAPDANLDAKILAKKPTKPGGQREARGACPHILQNRRDAQNTNRTPNAKSAPLPRL